MGILRPLVNRAQSVSPEASIAPSDKRVTPANVMTASRPLLGVWAARTLLRGKKYAVGAAFIAGITDMEGYVARKVDQKWPESGRGRSNKGKMADPIADTIMLAEVATGALLGPRVSRLGKAAVIIAIGQEAYKAQQAIRLNNTYQALTGEALDVPITMKGKEAMAEKMLGVGLATLTNSFDNSLVRTVTGAAALGFSVAGALRGHSAHLDNMEAAYDMISAAQQDRAIEMLRTTATTPTV